MRAAITTILLLALGASASGEISVKQGEGTPRVTVRATNLLATEILQDIARQTGRVLLRSDGVVDTEPLSSVELRDRAVDEVVEILAGSAGLTATIRQDSITLSPEPVVPKPNDLRVRALAAHARSVLAHPRRPEVIRTRLAIAELHLQLDQADSAVDELLRSLDALRELVVEEDSRELRVLTRTIACSLGEAYSRLEQWERVIHYQAALAIDDECAPEILLRLGRAYAALGQPEAARTHLRRVMEEGAGEIEYEVELLLGNLARNDGKPAEAVSHLIRASRSDDPLVGGTALLALAEAHESHEAPASAVGCLADFDRRFPDDERAPQAALRLVATLAGPLDNPLRAVSTLERTLEKHPDCMDPVEATRRIAGLQAKTGLIESARARLETEIEKLTDDDPARAALLEDLAKLLEDALMPARARAAYRKLAVLPEHRIRARLKAARCLLRVAQRAPGPREQRLELVACLEEIRALDPKGMNATDRDLRIELEVACLNLLGDPEGARRAMEEGLK